MFDSLFNVNRSRYDSYSSVSSAIFKAVTTGNFTDLLA